MRPPPPPDSPRLPIARHGRYPGFLAPEERAAVLDWALANEAMFAPAWLRKGVVNPEVRSSRVLRDLKPLGQMLKQRLLDLLPRILEDIGIAAFDPSHVELEIAAHGDGDRFTLHTDTYKGDARPERGDRMVSGVYYFHREPKGFGGGELRLHRFSATAEASQDFVAIGPEQNSLVVFPAWAPHEVRPVCCPSKAFADSRFSVNCWIYRPRGKAS
jgi:Rps23 Pro-64 3,4-dihydroxylase Tpa1-like proline 4-hydroxylase